MKDHQQGWTAYLKNVAHLIFMYMILVKSAVKMYLI